jgi:predicted nucleic acid-binding protein
MKSQILFAKVISYSTRSFFDSILYFVVFCLLIFNYVFESFKNARIKKIKFKTIAKINTGNKTHPHEKVMISVNLRIINNKMPKTK